MAAIGNIPPPPICSYELMEATSNTSEVDIQSLLRKYMDDHGTVGACIGFIDRGKVQLFSSGEKTIGGAPISTDTIFQIGSITKVFTTLALVHMAEKGIVHLDDPIEKHLPSEVRILKEGGKKITLGHLAMHTSGLPRIPDNLNIKNPHNPYEDYTIENLYEYLNHCTLSHEPGEFYEYSNLGMGLLGHILSLRSGKSYEELIQSLISETLEMKDTTISLSPEMSQRCSRGHLWREEVQDWDVPALPGCGAFRSTIEDMTHFLAANMGLSPSPLVKLLQQCHQRQSKASPTLDVGMGWHISNPGIIWHNGQTGGFTSYLGFNPNTQRGVVILTNSKEDWPDELGMALLDPNFQRPFIDQSLANSPDYLNKFVGTYEVTLPNNPTKQDLLIYVLGKRLAVAITGVGFDTFYPESLNTFGVQGTPDQKIHFIFNAEGKVSNIRAVDSSKTTLWEAVPKIEKSD